MYLALDIATRRTGWCVGDGSRLPTAGCWEFPQVGNDIGLLLDRLHDELVGLREIYPITDAVFEAPILVVKKRRPGQEGGGGRTDKLLVIRKIYSMEAHFEWVCRRIFKVPCNEVDLHDVKRELAGRAFAEKDEMVAAARKVGVVLPKGEGAKDAADAFGAWLLLLRARNRNFSARFDAALYGSRGGLL